MNPIKMSEKLPQNLVNVFVNRTIAHQPYWTRAYRNGDTFTAMTYSDPVEFSIDEIEEWMPLPNHWNK